MIMNIVFSKYNAENLYCQEYFDRVF